jgi:hypothetical protein
MQRILVWIFWLVSVAANGMINFLWIVFGAAGAGNAGFSHSTYLNAFIATAVAGTMVPLIFSIHFLRRGRDFPAVVTPFAMWPMAAALFLAIEPFLKKP